MGIFLTARTKLCVLCEVGPEKTVRKGFQLGGWLSILCTQNPPESWPRLLSEILIFPHILQPSPIHERQRKLLQGEMFSLFPLNLSSHTFNLGHVIGREYH